MNQSATARAISHNSADKLGKKDRRDNVYETQNPEALNPKSETRTPKPEH